MNRVDTVAFWLWGSPTCPPCARDLRVIDAAPISREFAERTSLCCYDCGDELAQAACPVAEGGAR